MIRVANKFGVIFKIVYKNVSYIAEGISEDYRGPAFIQLKDKSCFTGIIAKLVLVTNVLNEYVMLFYGPEEQTYKVVFDEELGVFKSISKEVKFSIDWEGSCVKKM